MDILLEHIYAEICSLSENIAYLKGRCDSIIEICAVNRFVNQNKKQKTKEEKELCEIEKKLIDIKDELNRFADKIPKSLDAKIKKYERNTLQKQSNYIRTMRGH